MRVYDLWGVWFDTLPDLVPDFRAERDRLENALAECVERRKRVVHRVECAVPNLQDLSLADWDSIYELARIGDVYASQPQRKRPSSESRAAKKAHRTHIMCELHRLYDDEE